MPIIFVGESFTVAVFWVPEKFGYEVGGVSTNSVGNVLSRSAEIFPRGILYCCSIFGYRKSLENKRVEYQHFPTKIFCLSVPKIFAGETLYAVF